MIQQPLTLDALRVLETIARRGSFAAAADELHRVTSAVSYTVQKLEEDLDIVLFDRSGHRAKLTVAGKLLVERGRDLLAASAQLVEDARAVACGWEPRLTIALDQVYPEQLLLPLVKKFYDEQAPTGANTNVRISAEVLVGAWDALESGRADIAIGSELVALPNTFRKVALGGVEFIYVAAPSHAVFQGDNALINLLDHRAIVVADTARQRAPRTVRVGTQQPTLTVSSFTAKIAALEAGLGIGTVPAALASTALTRGSLKRIPLPVAIDQVELFLASRVEPRGRAENWFLEQLPPFFKVLAAECEEVGRRSEAAPALI
ncbi:MAG: LysR family transcriptional regulator [Verrucomicrobiaceae bacterium]|nr:LysR family transcriptional regulator [Verrucomicrobiaceae bacterium]